jgi:branched-chain amino acid transport system permease protein
VKQYTRFLWPLVLGAVLCFFPLFLDDYYTHMFVLVFIWAFLAMGWNVIGGYCGQHSLGHGLYMGLAAYFTAYLLNTYNLTPWIGMFVGMGVAAIAAWFIGWAIFRYRIKGAYFALVTIALTEAAVYIVSNIPAFGGAGGIQENIKSGLLWLQWPNKAAYFYMGVVFTVGGLLFAQWCSRKRFFYYLQAVRENDEAAEALGVNTVREKIKANIMSAVWVGLGGVFYVQYFLYVGPRSVFGETVSVQILLFAIIGGLSTVWGPFIGALILVPVGEITRSQLGTVFQGASLLIYGAVMVLVMLFMPYGILGLINLIKQKINLKRTGTLTGVVEGGEEG